jgi:hypothetical protein
MRNFKFGRTEIHDFHRSERPLIDHIDHDIMFLLRTFSFHTIHTLAETLSIAQVQSYIICATLSV